MTAKERIMRYIKETGKSVNAFERGAGLSVGYLRQLRKEPSREKIKRIILAFPDLNEGWLLTGEGPMLNSQRNSVESTEGVNKRERLIPFYDVESTGGFEGKVSSSEEGDVVGYIQPGGWFDGMETAAIRHVGDSMIEYPNGCILAVKKVNDRNLLVPGRNYVIETSEYRITKRVQLGNTPDTLRLYSTNTEKYDDGRLIHEPFDVYFEDIINIYSVLGYIVNQSGEMRLIRTK